MGDFLYDEPMKKHCSWRTGGVAKLFFRPSDSADLHRFLTHLDKNEAILWLGLGSNLLVRDGGFNGVVISLKGRINAIQIDHETMHIEAGCSCAKAAREAARAGLVGLEFLAGIPGTVGGALKMNAGGFGGETWQQVKLVELMDRHGNTRQANKNDFNIGYRHIEGLLTDEFFIRATFQLKKGNVQQAQQRIQDLLSVRAESQPIGEASCGSVFKNPKNYFAAALIEACGLKGKRQGGAVISEKHANFIINQNQASASDIETLIQFIQSTVQREKGVLLETEVQIVGEVR